MVGVSGLSKGMHTPQRSCARITKPLQVAAHAEGDVSNAMSASLYVPVVKELALLAKVLAETSVFAVITLVPSNEV